MKESEIRRVLKNLVAGDCRPRTMEFILNVLKKFPESYVKKLFDEDPFIIDTEESGSLVKYIPHGAQDKPIIIFVGLEKHEDRKAESIIAHEFTHVILEHKHVDSKPGKIKLWHEKEADDFIEKWGFKRTYKSYGTIQ